MLQDFKLVVFETLARTGNFRRAASELDVSQPTVSQIVSDLEKEVGRPLFVRGRAGSTLTPAGESFLLFARGITDSYEEMRLAMRDFDRLNSIAKVSLYVSEDRLGDVCGRLLPYLRRAFPGMGVELVSRPEEADVRFLSGLPASPSDSFAASPLFPLIVRIVR